MTTLVASAVPDDAPVLHELVRQSFELEMDLVVLGPVAHVEVVGSVVLSPPIDVVDDFADSKSPTQASLGHQDVLGNVLVGSSGFGRQNHRVAQAISKPAAPPRGVGFTASRVGPDGWVAGALSMVLERLMGDAEISGYPSQRLSGQASFLYRLDIDHGKSVLDVLP